MSEYGERLDDGSLRFVRMLPGPIERIWAWIAEGDKRAQWLCDGGDASVAGEIIKYDFNHNRLTPHAEIFPDKYKDMAQGVSFDVGIKLCEPPNHMVLLWPNEEGMVSEIDIHLSGQDGTVTLELIQRGEMTVEELLSSSAGWHTHLNIMEDKLEGKMPKAFWPVHEALVSEYATRFGLS